MKAIAHVLTILGTTGALLLGCAADTDGSDDGAVATEDALRASDLPDVVAATITDYKPSASQPTQKTTHPTIASKKKMKALLTALKKAPSTNGPQRRCSNENPRRRISFVDQHGTEKASATIACTGQTLNVPGREPVRLAADSAAIQAIVDAPLVPADVLFGVDRVTIKKRDAGSPVVVADEARIAEIVGAIDGEELIVPFRVSRCLPSRALTFAKAGRHVATVTWDCNAAGGRPNTEARFFTPEPESEADLPRLEGGITLDSRVIEEVPTTP